MSFLFAQGASFSHLAGDTGCEPLMSRVQVAQHPHWKRPPPIIRRSSFYASGGHPAFCDTAHLRTIPHTDSVNSCISDGFETKSRAPKAKARCLSPSSVEEVKITTGDLGDHCSSNANPGILGMFRSRRIKLGSKWGSPIICRACAPSVARCTLTLMPDSAKMCQISTISPGLSSIRNISTTFKLGSGTHQLS